MYKKTYEKPTMTIVQLNQHEQLLTSSVQAGRSSYGNANSEVIETELNTDGDWEWN